MHHQGITMKPNTGSKSNWFLYPDSSRVVNEGVMLPLESIPLTMRHHPPLILPFQTYFDMTWNEVKQAKEERGHKWDAATKQEMMFSKYEKNRTRSLLTSIVLFLLQFVVYPCNSFSRCLIQCFFMRGSRVTSLVRDLFHSFLVSTVSSNEEDSSIHLTL